MMSLTSSPRRDVKNNVKLTSALKKPTTMDTRTITDSQWDTGSRAQSTGSPLKTTFKIDKEGSKQPAIDATRFVKWDKFTVDEMDGEIAKT